MAILDHGRFPWIVSFVCLCIAGCQQAQPAQATSDSAPAASSAGSGWSGPAAGSVKPPPSAASNTAANSSKSSAAGSAGTATSTVATAGTSGSAPASAGAPSSTPASAGAPSSTPASAGASGAAPVSRDAGVNTPDASVDTSACAPRTSTASATGFVGDWTAGTYPDDFTSASAGKYLTIGGLPHQAGMDREYAVHVPVGYEKSAALPVLFCLHAFSMNARSFCVDMAGWPAKADKEKLIVIMPNGYQNSWNIGEGCGAALLPVHTEGIDDVEFIRALLDEVGKHVNIDLSRVYATGFSNGSSLAWRLACDASDIFTAVVPVAAGSCLASCKPSHKVSILDVYGAADSFNPTEDLAASMAALQAINGCAKDTMPATVPMTTGAAKCLTSMGCSSSECSRAEVTQCVVQNGSHCWYNNISNAECGTSTADGEFTMTNLAWEFLKRLSR